MTQLTPPPPLPALDARSAAGLVRRWRKAVDPDELACAYDALAEAGPLVPTPWGALLVTGHEDCRQVLADRVWRTLGAGWRDTHRPGWRSSPGTVGLCETPLQQDPPEHTARRRPLNTALAPRAMREAAEHLVEPLVARYVGRFAAAVRDTGSADVVAEVCRPLPTAVLAGLTGMPPEVDRAWLAAESAAMVRVEELAAPPSVVRRADAAAVALLACYDRVLAERLRRPAGDLLSRWAAEDPHGARYLLLTLFSAGVPTTAALLASVALALTTRPLLAERIRQDPGFAEPLTDEVLRWDPPGRVVTRVAAAGTELAGRDLPAGQVVHALIGAAHRDPLHFPDPHAFDPDRPPRRLLAFGTGLHYCLGSHLARTQAVAFARCFARALPGARATAPPERHRGPSMADIARLPVHSARETEPSTSSPP
ncbi:cytochrome P450 [Streptomyces sp. NPDC088733]|uniref:cytochrome P450 n=1 Tax=Streptomyces sp. NPDC088733 TaxID=3365880 RepID=UPI00381811F1